MSERRQALDSIARLIDEKQRFLVMSHVGPDGDAVGSTLALSLLLESLGKDVVAYNQDSIPYNFAFLAGGHLWTTKLPDEEFDVGFVLDCAEPSRTGDAILDAKCAQVVVIDHHRTWDPDFADIYFRDVEAAATGELVFEVVEACGKLSPEISRNLYTCLLTDTGSFRYSNTTGQTFRVAARLIDAGVDAWEMASSIYEAQPRERLTLISRVLQTLEYSPCGRLAFLRVEAAMIPETKHPGDLTDGIINFARSVEGVEVATQLTEAEGDQWRVSFRSRGRIDVSSLAQRFGGGGHFNAAGCTMSGTYQQVQKLLSDALEELLPTR